MGEGDTMQAQDMMMHDVHRVNHTDSIRTVLAKLIHEEISGMPVTDRSGNIVAYISEEDIMRYIGKHKDFFVDSLYTVAVIPGDRHPFDERIEEVLDLNVMELADDSVLTASVETAGEEVAALLGKDEVKKLPVEEDGRLVGIISRGDVIRHIFHSKL